MVLYIIYIYMYKYIYIIFLLREDREDSSSVLPCSPGYADPMGIKLSLTECPGKTFFFGIGNTLSLAYRPPGLC